MKGAAAAIKAAPVSPGRSRRGVLERSALWRHLPDIGWVAFFVCATGAATKLGVPNGERIAWLILDAIVAICVIKFAGFLEFSLRHWIMFSWAALACFSAIWSLAPFVSAYHGVQLFMTIAGGLLLSASMGLARMMRALFAALLLTAVLSLLINILAPEYATGWQGAWTGAFSHKNTLGGMMALLIITSVPLLLSSWRPALTALTCVLAAGLLIMSKSGTALLSVTAGLAAFVPFVIFSKSARISAGVLGATLLVSVFAAGSVVLLQLDLAQVVLEGLGKDPSMSGRTVLWEFGADAFSTRPLLGFGFKGYWENETTTVQLLRFAIGSDLWFFHNNFIEVAVGFGIIGPVLLALGLLWAFFHTGLAAARATTILHIWPFALVTFVFVQCFSENPLFSNHSVMQVLFAAAASVSAALRQRDKGAG